MVRVTLLVVKYSISISDEVLLCLAGEAEVDNFEYYSVGDRLFIYVNY